MRGLVSHIILLSFDIHLNLTIAQLLIKKLWQKRKKNCSTNFQA